MLIGCLQGTRHVHNQQALQEALSYRDNRGGAVFWLTHDGEEYPKLAIRVSGEIADVHFFPKDAHPGFRCLGGAGLPQGGMTTLVFDGCDPGAGEDTPNEFVVPVETAGAIAAEFLRTGQRSAEVEWCEL